MTPRLKSVTITDFRSVRGTVTVPLDSPVVLIHGQNGTGKTSLLAAIELGLTGQVASLARLDPTFGSHLVHKEALEGRVSVTVERAPCKRPEGDGDSRGRTEVCSGLGAATGR